MSAVRRLTHQRVRDVYRFCSAPRQKRTGIVEIEGISSKHTMTVRRVELRALEIRDMLGDLPDAFRRGDRPEHKQGWSVGQMIIDRHGTLWTQDFETIEMLCVLGLAAGVGGWCERDRARWARFPYGLPYFYVDIPWILQ